MEDPLTVEIDTARFRSQIEALLREKGLAGCVVVIVTSVQQWAADHGWPEPNDRRVARVFTRGDGVNHIVLLATITRELQRGITDRLLFGGFEVERLKEPSAFLEHLVLHEVAHLLGVPEESECDRWAFDHLAGRFH